jgi:hypothetical protein
MAGVLMDRLSKILRQLSVDLMAAADALDAAMDQLRQEWGDTNLLVSTLAEYEARREADELKEKEVSG